MSGIHMDDGCGHMNGAGFPDHGLWLAARDSNFGKDFLWGVYVTDPVVPTVSGPKLTAWDQECATVGNMHKHLSLYSESVRGVGEKVRQ